MLGNFQAWKRCRYWAGTAPNSRVLLDNHGFSNIGSLSQSVGSHSFGTHYRRPAKSGQLEGEVLSVDFVDNIKSLGGAQAVCVQTIAELQTALFDAKKSSTTTAIVIEVDREQRVPGYESWWAVAVGEVSEVEESQQARRAYEQSAKPIRDFV